MMDKILLGSTILDPKDNPLTLKDSKGFVAFNVLGVDESFYGGRVDNVAKTAEKGVYLLVEGEQVIDIAIDSLDILTKRQLAYYAKRKFGKEISENWKKDEMIVAIETRTFEKPDLGEDEVPDDDPDENDSPDEGSTTDETETPKDTDDEPKE